MNPVTPVLPNQPETKPIEIVLGKNQPQYRDLPCIKLIDGDVITRYELSDEEVAEIVKTKSIYIITKTFNQPFQPILPQVDAPEITLYQKGEG